MSTFDPKPFAEIVAAMVEQMRVSTDRVTDFNVGSVVRSILEACAAEVDDYYQSVYLGLLRSIPVAIYNGFGFDLRAPIAAAGTLRVSRVMFDPGPETIPEGAVARSATGWIYRTLGPVTFGANETLADVLIVADDAGAGGNADPGAVTLASGRFTGVNLTPISGGRDQETEDQRAERFAAFLLSLSRGTVASLEYAATEPALFHPITGVLAERVQRASCHETAGHVDLYIHNGSYGASDALVAAVQSWVDGARDEVTGAWVGGYRPAGMRVDVHPLTEQPLDITLEITRRANASVSGPLQGAIDLLLRHANPGALIHPLDIVQAALAVDGVLGASIVSPTTAIHVPHDAILRLGVLTLA